METLNRYKHTILEEPEEVFCPFCNERVMRQENGQNLVKPCRHMAFFHDTIEGHSLYFSDKFQKLIDDNDYVDLDSDVFESLEELKVDPEIFHVIETKEDGMGCGPFSYVCYYGFDKEQDQDISEF